MSLFVSAILPLLMLLCLTVAVIPHGGAHDTAGKILLVGLWALLLVNLGAEIQHRAKR
jgi:hypothetical protein